MHSFRRGFWFFQGHTWTCAHTHAPPHTCAHSASPAVALVDTPHTEALPADISSSVFSLCVSLRPEERRGRCLLLAWQCRVGGGCTEVSGSWLSLLSHSPWDCRQYYRTHTLAGARTHTYTRAQLKSGQLPHTQFNQGLCLWKRAYVTSSVSALSSPPASPSFLPVHQCFTLSVSWLPASLSVWLPVFFDTFHLSCHIHCCMST